MKKALIVLACIVYVASPLDLIPDFIPVLGQLDDLAVIVLTVRALMKSGEAVVRRIEE